MKLINDNFNELTYKLREIGKEILKIYSTKIEVDIKEDNSPLTQADSLSNKMLVEYLTKTNIPIISEEIQAPIEERDTNLVWIIDPLDGTKDFIQKTDEFSIMIALIQEGKPIFGMVYIPVFDKFYYAIKGQGAYQQVGTEEPKQMFVSTTQDLSEFRLVKSRNHFMDKDKQIVESLSINKFKPMGSAGIKFGEIAKGDAELSFYSTSKIGIWDCAASHIILQEAGGEFFDSRGREPEYDFVGRKMKYGFIGTNGTNKQEILEAIHKVEKNIRKEKTHVSKHHRRDRNKHHSTILWFTGLSGSGKSTLAREVQKELFDLGVHTYILDGDNMRFGLNKDLGFSATDREENVRRIGEVSKLFVDAGAFVLSAFISPYTRDRDLVRNLVEDNEFIEIHVNCTIEECERRDAKGLYKKARAGLIKGFTGIDDPYEEPLTPDIIVHTHEESPEESVEKILDFLKDSGYL